MKNCFLLLCFLLLVGQCYAQTAKEWFDKGYKERDFNKAVEYFTKAIEKGYKPLADAYFYRANLKNDLGLQREAIDDYTKAIQFNPNHIEAYLYRGMTRYFVRGDERNNAIEDYNRVLKLKPNHVEAYFARGVAYHASDEYTKAIADFNTVIKLDPKFAMAYYRLAEIKGEEFGLAEEAVYYLNKFVQLEPNNDEGYSERGYYKHYGLSLSKEALLDFDKAIQLNPKVDYYYSDRGECRYSLKLYKEAIADFKKVLELSPNDANIKELITLAETALAEQNARANPAVTGNTLTQFQIKKTNIIVVQYVSLLIEHGKNPNSSVEPSKEILRLFDSRENLVYNDIGISDENIEVYAYLNKIMIGEEKIKFDFAEKTGKFNVQIYKDQYTAVNLTKTIKGNGINKTVKIKVIINPAKGKIVNIIKN